MIRPEEMRKELICPNCKAYQMHDYLSEHGQIVEEGNPLLMELEQLKQRVERYEQPNLKCGKGHINNLPLSLWDCPMCTEEKRAELEQYKRALELACDNLEIYTSSTRDKWKNYYLAQAKELNVNENC